MNVVTMNVVTMTSCRAEAVCSLAMLGALLSQSKAIDVFGTAVPTRL